MKKRSVSISGHRTSISLEKEFWELLNAIARKQNRPLARLIAEVDRNRIKAADPANLSSALRVYVLKHVMAARDESGSGRNGREKD
ncbi:ribbon-helix-helix domain-containing protein [Aquisalinus flavus]|uniref:Aryl-sulfate sulfotransferase n=1 Tax=Aquisalinus flavus TaxID=1526572 RepID=A0A8J2V3G7_9PROT|nr:ribbon-helix-helix domain-containing protein [Aquisalinus flavus]MBD0426865.1 ribbon-helix-helix domain-containing protein [Aquisalinus flavus]UNE46711.1 ribbon-helix-helix domain-containing protein [Aquisalinus flavus]GGC96577.1 aryl-sulfate sulfotransferase [Aquisalinus flavus]